jgi:methionyl-tRNA synthetase
VLLYPVMPNATSGISQQLGLSDDLSRLEPARLKWGELPEGTQIGEVKPLFPRIDKAKTMEGITSQKSEVRSQRSEPAQVTADTNSSCGQGEQGISPAVSEGSSAAAPVKNESGDGLIDISDFAKVELRVGQVLTAEHIPKADKLLLITVDIGEEKPRHILAGIAQYYEPEQLIGRKIVVVANLKPRKLRGYESQGMLLAASVGEEGKPVIATFAEDVPNGARLK